jgi:hypothetical protein
MSEVTWAALLYGCMSSSLAEEKGLPFYAADVREQLGEVIFKQVCLESATCCYHSNHVGC